MRAATVALLAIACVPSAPAPLVRVLSSAPSGAVAPDEVAIEVAFSAPIDATGVEDGRWFALCRREDLRDVLRAIESEQGLAADAPVVPARRELVDGGRRAILQPAAPLAPERAWAAILSTRVRAADGRPWVDQEGKARSLAVLFETGPAVDRSAPRPRWLLPPHGPIPVNVRAFQVIFDEPVSGALGVPMIAAQPSRQVAADLLEVQLAEALVPGAFTLDLGDVTDRAGNHAAPLPPLDVSPCAADVAPPLGSELRVVAGRLAFSVAGTLRGMGRLVAEVTATGTGSCGVAPEAPHVLSVEGAVSACPGWDPCASTGVECGTTLEVTGVCPGRELVVRIATEDLAGHRSPFSAPFSVASLPPVPQPVVTEVLADAEAPENGGEYVEVANVGTGDLDLAGYALVKRTGSGKLVRCTITGSGQVAPGAYAVIVGGDYDGRYALPAGTPVLRCGATALDGGLANDQPVAIALQAPTGNVVSSAGFVEAVERCATGALERIHPDHGDAASNWACPGTRSPGSCNAVTPGSECPRRPW